MSWLGNSHDRHVEAESPSNLHEVLFFLRAQPQGRLSLRVDSARTGLPSTKEWVDSGPVSVGAGGVG